MTDEFIILRLIFLNAFLMCSIYTFNSVFSCMLLFIISGWSEEICDLENYISIYQNFYKNIILTSNALIACYNLSYI